MKKLLLAGGVVATIIGGILLVMGLMKVGEAPARLTWREPEVKPALMSFAYNIYGNPKVEFGRHHLAKMVFKNVGEHPVTDFSISYKLDGYIPWTDPEVIRSVPGGYSFVQLYYPRLPATVSKLRNATNTALHIRVRWQEEGRQREETFARDLILRGVNEIAYCDLPAVEVQSWFDMFNAAAFTMAMVTPNDPVVHLYSSKITKQAGGTTAGIAGGAEEVARLCRTIYNYMQATGLRYTGDKGFPVTVGSTTTLVQNVRLPRDVIINNQGLCIELTLLWCSLLEHMGVKTAMVLIPGHAFIIAYSPSQGMPIEQALPIETTAITPRAVGSQTAVPFEGAVKMAHESLQRAQQDGRIIILPVEEIQKMGFVPAELEDVDIDKLAATLDKRLAPQQPATPVVRQQAPSPVRHSGGGPVPSPVSPPVNTITWTHPQGFMQVSYPADFVSTMAVPNPWSFLLSSMGNPQTSLVSEVMQVSGAQDTNQAIAYLSNAFASAGIMVQVNGSRPMRNGATMYHGISSSLQGSVQWECVAKPVPGGVVVVTVGANPAVWPSQRATAQAIISSIRFR
jgi:hypothetical protein